MVAAASVSTSFSGTATANNQVLATDLVNVNGDVTLYRFICTVACWIAQGTADAPPAAAASATGSMLIPANTETIITGGRPKLAVIRQGGSDGICCITRITMA